MALTIADCAYVRNQPQRYGQLNERVVDVTGDSSYPTGGESFLAADVGFDRIIGVSCIAVTDGADAVSNVCYDAENDKLLFLDEAGADVTNAEDVSGVTVRLRILGY